MTANPTLRATTSRFLLAVLAMGIAGGCSTPPPQRSHAFYTPPPQPSTPVVSARNSSRSPTPPTTVATATPAPRVTSAPNNNNPTGQSPSQLNSTSPPLLLPGTVFKQKDAIAEADPMVEHDLVIRVPTAINVVPKGNILGVSLDTSTMATAKIKVGANMLLGVKVSYQSHLAVATNPDGTPVAGGGTALSGIGPTKYMGGDRDRVSFSTGTINQPYTPGKKTTVEMVVTVFETNIPPDIGWAPESGAYRELWTKTLDSTVE